jgi:cell division protein FtsW
LARAAREWCGDPEPRVARYAMRLPPWSGRARGWWPGAKRRSSSGLAATISELPTGTVLAVIVGLLCVIGLVMVGSASSVVSISLYGSPWAILIREAMWMGVGVIAFGVAVRFDHRKLRRLAPLLLVVTFFLLLVVLVPGLGVHVQGSSRWIGFGQFRLQPSELMKLALTVFAADLITRRLDEGATDRRIIGPLLLVTASAGLLIVMQPDLGTAMVLGCIVLALLFVSGVRLGPVLKILAGLVGSRSSWRSSRPTGGTGSCPSWTRRPTDRGRGTR